MYVSMQIPPKIVCYQLVALAIEIISVKGRRVLSFCHGCHPNADVYGFQLVTAPYTK